MSAERRRVRCTHCKRMMRLRAVAIYPPATTKILRGLGVNLHGLGFTGPPWSFSRRHELIQVDRLCVVFWMVGLPWFRKWFRVFLPVRFGVWERYCSDWLEWILLRYRKSGFEFAIRFFESLDLVCEKGIAQVGLDGYFGLMEKAGLNSLSVFCICVMYRKSFFQVNFYAQKIVQMYA